MPGQDGCPIWGTAAAFDPAMGDYSIVDSPRAGGKYWISGTVAGWLIETCDDRWKARLTTFLVDQRNGGNEMPRVDDKRLQWAKDGEDLPVWTRAERLLGFIAGRIDHLGHDYTLPSQSTQDDGLEALAHSESIDPSELAYLEAYLVSRAWLRKLQPNSRVCRVTVDGYRHLAELATESVNSRQAFVAMWFDESMDEVYDRAIRPAIEEAGYRPYRVDMEHFSGRIDDKVIAEIRRSRFLVADFSHGSDGARGSVYYEAGFAHGLGLEVIFCCRDGTEPHFDTRQYNHIMWKDMEDLRERLLTRVLAHKDLYVRAIGSPTTHTS